MSSVFTVRHILWIVYVALPLLGACRSLHPGYPGGELVGHLGVSGTEVTRQRGAAAPETLRNGAAVNERDRVATGANSSAILEYYNGGGKLQLDASSAARFRKERTAPGVCSLVDLLQGQAWIRADEGCGVELRALDYVVRINGRANVVLNDERFEVTVTSGRAALLQPRTLQLSAGQSYADGDDARVRELDKADSKTRLAWLEPYAFQGWCCYGRDVMPARRSECLPPNFSFDETTLTMQCKHRDGAFSSFFSKLRRR